MLQFTPDYNMYLNELLETQKKTCNSYAVNFKQMIKLLRFWLTTKIIKKDVVNTISIETFDKHVDTNEINEGFTGPTSKKKERR